MQHISEKWLKRFNYLYILYSLIILALYAVAAFNQQTPVIKNVNTWGMGPGTAIFALSCIIFNLAFMRPVKRYNLWLAYVISYILVSITNVAATELALGSSGEYVFIGMTYTLSLLSITLGPIIGIGVLTISAVITGMVVAENIEPTALGVTNDMIAFGVRSIIVITGIYLLHNKYETSSFGAKQNYIERYFVSNEVVSLLTNSISDGVIIIDQNEVVRSINPAAQKIINQPAKNVIDLNYRSVLKLKKINGTAIEDNEEPILQALKSGKPVNKELLLQVPGLPEIFIDINISVIADEQTKEIYGATIIMRDVSNRKKEESARSDFISTASHEMRTPVAAIEGYIELALNEKVSRIDDTAKKYLEKAKMSTEHLGRLFQDLLASAKAEDGRISNRPQVIEIGKLFEQQAEMSKMAAQQKGLQFEFIISPGGQSSRSSAKTISPLYYVLADPDRIRELASNLIDNAIKYTPSGKITLGLTGDKDVVQFFVKDTGVGIAQEDISHLFQKFYRVDSTDTRTTGGTGLGLYITKEIAELYHGRVWVESEKGKGTTFYVNIPRMNTAQAEASIANDQNSSN